jgi:uncharacterized protein (TIGR03084 family)
VDAICDDLAAEHAALDAVVAGLDEAGWDAATPAAGWTVKDTIVHLVQADLAARLAATEPDEFIEVRSRILTGGFDGVLGAGAGRTGADVLRWWRGERAVMLDAFRARGPKERIPWFGPDMSALSFATARLMETWAHGTDVATTVGAELPATDRLRHVAHIGVSTRGWSYVNRGMVPPADPVRVELTAPSGELWTWGPDEADDRVTGPALDFCLLVTQRCHQEDTDLVADGALAEEWLSLAQAFAGPPTTPQTDRRVRP